MKVCFARAADYDLTDLELEGVSAHELGHVIGDTLGFPEHVKSHARRTRGTPWKVQAEANRISKHLLGLPIRYNDDEVQELA